MGQIEKLRNLFTMKKWFMAAAIAALLFIVGWFLISQLGSSVESIEAFADNRIVELEDGSVVTLTADAHLTVSEDYGHKYRTVYIDSGKAFFQVAPDPETPFHVIADGTEITVSGTSFAVRRKNNQTITEVEEGVVVVRRVQNLMEVKLQKGEMAITSKTSNGIVKRKNRRSNYLSWKTGVINFQSTKLIEVADVLEDTYGKEFVFPPNAHSCRLTVKFNQQTLNEVVKMLALTFNWSYDIQENQVVFSGSGC